MNKLVQTVSGFLKKQADLSRPFLLALSGGVDSVVLLDILLKLQKKSCFEFAVVHVNHNWRQESQKEAEQLFAFCLKNRLQFHLHEIEKEKLKGNLELVGRQERRYIFKKLCQQWGYQAAVLAHHADDQAETVLKRLFESASLGALSGMRKVSCQDGLTLWRPLLSLKKSELMAYAKKNELTFFSDPTNKDTAFCRANMRQELIPQLSKSFGKQILPSLVHLSEQASELECYINDRLNELLGRVISGPMGDFVSKQLLDEMHLFERRLVVKQLAQKLGAVVNHRQQDEILKRLADQKANAHFIVGPCRFEVDRGSLFCGLKEQLTLPAVSVPLKSGVKFGPWKVEVKKAEGQNCPLTGWENLLQGKIQAFLPKSIDSLMIAKPETDAYYPGSKNLSKWWNKHKVPAHLFNQVPVIVSKQGVELEFLSGRQKQLPKNQHYVLELTMG